MRVPALAILVFFSTVLFPACNKLEQNASFSTTLLDRFSVDNKLNSFSLTPYDATNGQSGYSGPYVSYTFSDGLNFIDELNLESLDTDQGDLFNNYISNVLPNELGDYWILTYSSLDYYDAETDSWRTWLLPANRQGFPIGVSPQRDGSIICVNDRAMLVFRDEQFFDLNDDENAFSTFYAGTLTSDGSLWLSGAGGLLVITDEGEMQNIRSVDARKNRITQTVSILQPGKVVEDNEGNIWLPVGDRLLRYDSGYWKLFDAECIPELDAEIQTITHDELGHIWLVSGMQLIRLFPDGLSEAIEIEGLKAEEYGQIAGLHVESDGHIWLIGSFGIIELHLDLPI